MAWPEKPETDKAMDRAPDGQLGPEEKFPWKGVGIVLGVTGSIATYIVTNWSQVEPVITSAPAVVLFMVFNLMLGMLIDHLLVSLPLRDRQKRSEGVINRMRERERELGSEITELKVELAKVRTHLDLIMKQQGLAPPAGG